jgi:hypothetical protein
MSAQSDKILRTLGRRKSIARAVEILKDKHHVSEAAALEMLIQGSSDAQVKVREIAHRIVEEHSAEQSIEHRRPTAQRDLATCRRLQGMYDSSADSQPRRAR